MLKLAKFQQSEAKKCGDPDIIWKAFERRLKAEEHLWDAKQDMMMAKVEMGVAKATAEKMGALLETGEGDRSSAPRPKDAWDEHISFDSDWGQNREFKCPKFDLFGCGCAELEGYETLSGGDCITLKQIMKTRRDNEYAEAEAASAVAAGMGKFDQMSQASCIVLRRVI